MKQLLSKLRQLTEQVNTITIDTIKDACLASYKFSSLGEDLQEMLAEGDEIRVVDYSMETGEVVQTLDFENIYICTKEAFEEIIDSSAQQYKFKMINDFLEPFFNDTEYYKSSKTDKTLTKFLLQEIQDVAEWEEVSVNGNEYVLFS